MGAIEKEIDAYTDREECDCIMCSEVGCFDCDCHSGLPDLEPDDDYEPPFVEPVPGRW